MIPKTIHQIHLGGKPLSDKESEWQATWQQYNPEWEMILWDEERVSQSLNITYPEIFESCLTFSEKSDILRFEILHQHGGLYIDTDFECLKPIDPIINGRELVVYREDDKMTCGAFFASTCGNSHVKSLIDNLPIRARSHGHRDPAFKFGPQYLQVVLPDEVQTPLEYRKQVYPYMYDEMHRQGEDFRSTTPEAYAVHHWRISWC